MLYYTTQSNGLKHDFTKNVKVKHAIKTLSWVAKNSKHTYVDRNWQRNFVWDTLKQMLFTTNIFNGHSTSTNMLLANVEDCLRYCQKNNEILSTEYFKSVLDGSIDGSDGYKHICIDGQNRMLTIEKFYDDGISLHESKLLVRGKEYEFISNHVPYYSTLPEDLKVFMDSREIPVSFVDESTLHGMTELFRNANDGMDLNDQELRTSYIGQVSQYILEKGRKMNRFVDCIGKVDKTRRGHEKLLAQMLLFQTNTNTPNIGKKGLDEMYQKALTSNSKFHTKNLKELSKGVVGSNTHKGDDNFYTIPWAMNEYIWTDIIHSFGYKITNHIHLHEFFLNMETMLRSEGKKVAEDDSYNKWSSGMGNLGKRQRALMTQFLLYRDYFVGEDWVVMEDSDRFFTKQQRYDMWLNEAGIDTIDGNTIPAWGVYSNRWEADHVKAYSRGGKTSVANGQLISKSNNRKKGAKVMEA